MFTVIFEALYLLKLDPNFKPIIPNQRWSAKDLLKWESAYFYSINVCLIKIRSKRSSVLLLYLLRIFMRQTSIEVWCKSCWKILKWYLMYNFGVHILVVFEQKRSHSINQVPRHIFGLFFFWKLSDKTWCKICWKTLK